MKINNIIIKQELKRVEAITDYYLKVKELSTLAGTVAFYAHTAISEADHASLQKTEKLASDTIYMLIKRYKL